MHRATHSVFTRLIFIFIWHWNYKNKGVRYVYSLLCLTRKKNTNNSSTQNWCRNRCFFSSLRNPSVFIDWCSRVYFMSFFVIVLYIFYEFDAVLFSLALLLVRFNSVRCTDWRNKQFVGLFNMHFNWFSIDLLCGVTWTAWSIENGCNPLLIFRRKFVLARAKTH